MAPNKNLFDLLYVSFLCNAFSLTPCSDWCRPSLLLTCAGSSDPHNQHDSLLLDRARRRMLQTAAVTPPLLFSSQPCLASDTVEFTGRDLSYSVQLPETMSQPSNKPLKTHLDEVNFNGNGVNVGITVDRVRINSLRQFGSPEEVAAKVVTAEVNRDGVFEVTLLEDPVELPDKSYLLRYLSKGKRGNKRNVCKIFIENQKLYVLTAQAKEDVYDKEVEKTIQAIVESFAVR